MSSSRHRAALAGTLLFGAARARGQDPLSATLAGDLAFRQVPDLYLAARFSEASDRSSRFFLVGQREFAFRTRRGVQTRDRYAANLVQGGLDLPFRLGRREALLQARLEGSRLDGLLNRGELPIEVGNFELALSRAIADRWAVSLAARRRETDAVYASGVLKETFSGFGVNPDIDLRLRETSAGVSARYAMPGLTLNLGFGKTAFGGGASAVGNGSRLTLPFAMSGREVTFALDHPIDATRVLGFHLNERQLSGDGDVEREGGRTIGQGDARLTNHTASLTLDQRLANGGRLLYGIERATTRFDATGFIPKAGDVGVSAPSGSSLRYDATAGVGLTDAAFRWETPRFRGRLTVGYRQALAVADASVGYDIHFILFNVGGATGQKLHPTNAGIFDVGFSRPVRGFDFGVAVEQVVPYVFSHGHGKAKGSGVGGSPGNGEGRSVTDGGWTLAILVGRRF